MTKLPKSESDITGKKKTRWPYIIAGTFIAFIAFVVFFYLAALIIVDANFIEEQFNKRLTKTTNGLYRFEVERLDFSLAGRSLQASGISLIPNKQELNQMADDSLPAFRYEINMSEISLDGINYLNFLRDGSLEMTSFHIDKPVISLMIDEDLEDESDVESQQSLHKRIAEQLPDITMEDLRITNATLAVWHKKDNQVREQVINGINLEFENVRINPVAAEDENRILFSEDVRLVVDHYEGESESGLYRFVTGPIQASTRDAFIQIDSISIEPTLSDPEFIDQLETRTSRNIFMSESIQVQEIDFRRFFDHQHIKAGFLTINNFLYDAYTDLGVPQVTPSKVPHEQIQELDFSLNIRQIVLNNGQINYSERAKDGARPGIIMLDSIQGTLYNLTNDEELMTIDEPARIVINGLVAGEGELDLQMDLPLLAPDFPIILSGKLGTMDAELFNSILVDLEGVRIRSGTIDSVMFDIQSFGDHATGTVRAAYHDLEIETLDIGDHTRNFGNQIESFIANNLLLRSSDEANEENNETLREGRVDYEMDRMEDSFLTFIVESILNGLLSTMVRGV